MKSKNSNIDIIFYQNILMLPLEIYLLIFKLHDKPMIIMKWIIVNNTKDFFLLYSLLGCLKLLFFVKYDIHIIH